MTPAETLTEAIGRVREHVDAVLDGLSDDDLRHRPTPDANPIGWLVWHLTRVQDDHVAGVAGSEQVYTRDGFAERFPFDADATGYGQTSEEVGSFTADAALLADYHRAVADRTEEYLATLSGDDLDAVVDENWDPPVTLGVRLVSVVDDDIQHAGQAAYVRGLLGK